MRNKITTQIALALIAVSIGGCAILTSDEFTYEGYETDVHTDKDAGLLNSCAAMSVAVCANAMSDEKKTEAQIKELYDASGESMLFTLANAERLGWIGGCRKAKSLDDAIDHLRNEAPIILTYTTDYWMYINGYYLVVPAHFRYPEGRHAMAIVGYNEMRGRFKAYSVGRTNRGNHEVYIWRGEVERLLDNGGEIWCIERKEGMR